MGTGGREVNRRRFFTSLIGGIGIAKAEQTLDPNTQLQVAFQHAGPNAKCFNCTKLLRSIPLYPLGTVDNVHIKIDTLAWPIQVCPNCGAVQCVQVP
jgi:hypothetical protein